MLDLFDSVLYAVFVGDALSTAPRVDCPKNLWGVHGRIWVLHWRTWGQILCLREPGGVGDTVLTPRRPEGCIHGPCDHEKCFDVRLAQTVLVFSAAP